MSSIKILLSIVSFFVISSIQAQSDSYKISGIVIEASSGQAIDYATVILKDKSSTDILSGTTTRVVDSL